MDKAMEKNANTQCLFLNPFREKCYHFAESKESTRPLVLARKNLVRASGLSFFV